MEGRCTPGVKWPCTPEGGAAPVPSSLWGCVACVCLSVCVCACVDACVFYVRMCVFSLYMHMFVLVSSQVQVRL